MRVKICGITQPEQGQAIARVGATALGFICVPSSPRYVSAAQIRAVVAQLPETTDKIGVFANVAVNRIQRLSNLPLALVRPRAGPCRGDCGYSQCVHDYGSSG